MNTIGTIHTEYSSLKNMPIQPMGAGNTIGRIVLHKEFQDGLIDLAGFSHIYLIYLFHLSNSYNLLVQPFLDDKVHGVFATRAPRRPNPIGISIVKITSIHCNVIEIEGADIVDGTPLLDIKPYIKQFDRIEHSRSGWLNSSADEVRNKKSDNQFI
ncbi:MAG: tRNA (N6-threonylcarbamoyladenosine(37)-N6)-methyltransferase TrmO [Candidatus Thiodiazotropha sp.]